MNPIRRSLNFPLLIRRFTSSSSVNEVYIPTVSNEAVSEIREYGHFQADLDPLKLQEIKERPSFHSLPKMESIYCRQIAYEFSHLSNIEEKKWLVDFVENNQITFSNTEKKEMAELMLKSETFDNFMQKRFAQVKRYSLEGCEAMMVSMKYLLDLSEKENIKECVIGMPHRGRLNLLTDLLNYPTQLLFSKLKGNPELPVVDGFTGDVLSHLFQSKLYKNMNVTLLPNPSHLEAINPVALGFSRAKNQKVQIIQLHGDAAFSGQGVVFESLQLSNLPSFTVDGTIHMIVNNQLGFTTGADSGRSSRYASDIAKAISAPIIHVNAENPENVAFASIIAFNYRQKFKKDVVIDLIGYRFWGHNELDEPSFTQPKMYKIIKNRQSTPDFYAQTLKKEGISVENIKEVYFNRLDEALKDSESFKPKMHGLQNGWNSEKDLETGASKELLKKIGVLSVSYPSTFKIHARLQKFHVESRLKCVLEGSRIDWATAEAIAFGTLLDEGYNVRISGQDVGRGTFSQRHVILVDQESEEKIIPLSNLKGKFEPVNSNLSEFAGMGFEYGFSLLDYNTLTIWEAQFGDFFNGAQIIIDTFISTKWNLKSGIVLLLPHGYDGAGPEHSSSKIERFLQMTNESIDKPTSKDICNMQVVNCTTSAQYFHLLRHQLKSKLRKPLIVASPKILLRLPAAVSTFDDMAIGTHFKPILGDFVDPKLVSQVVFVSGKIFYDLDKARGTKQRQDVALIRIEEISPFPWAEITEELSKYEWASKFIWCQEEPENMGAYLFVKPRLENILEGRGKLKYIGRKPYAAPATGLSAVYKKEQTDLIEKCFE